jgi:endonuclease YncB( thermonuclease family)
VRRLLAFLTCGVMLLWPVAPAGAAEVLQVRSASLLQVGDRNRSYPVRLACIAIPAEREAEAAEWLRRELPRRARVNLRPTGSRDGTLVAEVTRLEDDMDLGRALVAADLARSTCPPTA